jgi:hypothetical protein
VEISITPCTPSRGICGAHVGTGCQRQLGRRPSVQKYGISWTDAAAGVPDQTMEVQEVEVQREEVPGLGKRRTSAI